MTLITYPPEVLLFIHHGDEPKKLTEHIRHLYDYVEVIFYKPDQPAGFSFASSASDSVPHELWQKATILVTFNILPPSVDLVPNLRWIQLLSAGVDHIANHPIYKDTDIPITTASGIHGPIIGEWVLMTTLNLAKNYNVMRDNQKSHKWDSKGPGPGRRGIWKDKTIGIAGYGSIGREVARVFSNFGCQTYAYTATPRSTPESRRDTGYIVPGTGDPDGSLAKRWYSGSTKEALHEFLSSGLDLLLISVPLTPQTKHMFGAEEFDVLHKASLLKANQDNLDENSTLDDGQGCIVTNISRGAVVDQAALIDALKGGKLLGAALDVTDPEPLPEDSELWDLDNVIVTPHISAVFKDYLQFAFGVLEFNLTRRQMGQEMVNLVNRDRGY